MLPVKCGGYNGSEKSMVKEMAGTLFLEDDGKLYISTMIGETYEVAENTFVTFTDTMENVKVSEIEQHHLGLHVIVKCIVQ